jgi:hypothetical protein
MGHGLLLPAIEEHEGIDAGVVAVRFDARVAAGHVGAL